MLKKFLFVVVLSAASLLRAQTLAPRHVSFDEAIARALDQSFNVSRAKLDVLSAKADRVKSFAQVGPRLSATYEQNEYDRAIIVKDEKGGPDIVYRAQANQGLLFTAYLNLSAIVASLQLIRMQTAQIDLSERAREIAQIETAFGVAEIYRMAQQAKEAVQVAKSRMEATAKNQRDAEALFALGKIAKTDKLQIDLVHNQALIDVARADNDFQNVQAALKKFLNYDGDEEIELDALKALTPSAVPELPSSNDALQVAFHERGDIAASQLQVSIRERGRWLTLNPYVPSVSGTMSWSRSLGSINVLQNNQSQWFTLNATWNFWDSGATFLDFRKASLDLRKARITERETVLDAKADVEKASRNLELAKETLRLGEIGLEQAGEAYRGTTLKFSLGAASVTDLLYAESAYNKAKLDDLAARVGLDVAYMKMKKALGEKRPVPL